MKNITLGQYFPGDSPIHRMDPRTKLLLVVGMIVLIFLVHSPWGYAAIFGALLLSACLSRISLRYLLRGIKPLWFMLVLVFLLNLFFAQGKTVLWHWNFIIITQEALEKAVEIVIRLVLMVLISTEMTLTTSPMEITDALEKLLKPLKAIRFPVHEMALMMSIALRFIPTLMEETDRIMKAQMARGADFETGGLIARAKGMVPILVPLFVGAFQRANDLALAMESRCYHGGEGRTRMKIYRFSHRDAWAALVFVGLIVFVAFGF